VDITIHLVIARELFGGNDGVKRRLCWKNIRKEVYAAFQPIESFSRKLRIEVDYQDGFFNIEMLMSKMQCFLEKMETCQEKYLHSF